jgi:hypothetical protein
LDIQAGDNTGLIISRDFSAPNDNGVFSFDFYPRTTYPIGGGVWVRLMQDATNYYEIACFQWDNVAAPGEPNRVTKVVSGGVVEEKPFANVNNYVSQIPPLSYHVTITYTPTVVTVQAFGETIVLNANTTGINVSKFEIQTNQQDAYYDNIQQIAVP